MTKNVDDAQMGRRENSGTFVDQSDWRFAKNVAHVFEAQIILTLGDEAIVVHQADPDSEPHEFQGRPAASHFKNVLGLHSTAPKHLIDGASGS